MPLVTQQAIKGIVGSDRPSQEVIACDKLMVTPGAICGDDKLTGGLSAIMEDLSKVKDAVSLTRWPQTSGQYKDQVLYRGISI